MRSKFKWIFTLLMALTMQFSFAQEKTITGVVSDASGPLPGVNVTIKGTQRGISTGFDGSYAIKAKEGETLVYSFMGMREVSKIVGSTNVINTVLQDDSQKLSEVIITGSAKGKTNKELTFTVAQVNSSALDKVPANDALNALQGKVSGLKVNSSSGEPGSEVSVLLRSANSLTTGQKPLVILDGVIIEGGLADINTLDIDRIEVVKGAAGASLYGSRAASGVIQIFSKRGKSGRTRVTYRTETGFSEITKKLDLATKHRYQLTADGSDFVFDSTGNRVLEADLIADNPYPSNYKVYDYQDELFRTGINTNHHISFEGGKENTNFLASYNRQYSKGVIALTDSYVRNNFRVNLDHNVSDKFKIGTSMVYGNSRRDPAISGTTNSNLFSTYLMEPFFDWHAKNIDGSDYLYNPSVNFGGTERNPLYTLANNEREELRNRFVGGFNASYQVLDWLKTSAEYSIDYENSDFTDFINKGYLSDHPDGSARLKGYIAKANFNGKSQNFRTEALLSKTFDKFSGSLKLGFLNERYNNELSRISGYGLSVSSIKTLDNLIPSAKTTLSRSENTITDSYYGVFDFDYAKKALFSVAYRKEGSSLFGTNTRWNDYYRASGAYRIITSNSNIENLSELKLRASVGTAGIRPLYGFKDETFVLTNGSSSKGTQGNPNLKPAVAQEIELGLNASFLKRFDLEFNYVKTNTTDQILLVPLSGATGFSGVWKNAGEMSAKTLEASLNANLIKNDKLRWDLTILWDKSTQKVEKLNVPTYLTGPGTQETSFFQVKEGEQFGAMYGNKFVRSLTDLPAGQNPANYSLNSRGYVVNNSTGAAVIYRDASGNSNFKIGDVTPDFNMSFSSTLKYKNFDLYALVYWKKGGDIYNKTKQWLYRDSRSIDVQNEGLPFNFYQSLYNINQASEAFVEDGSFVRLKESSIYYTLTKEKFGKVGNFLDEIKIGLIGRNLLTATDYTGADPEIAHLSEQNRTDLTSRASNGVGSDVNTPGGDPNVFKVDNFSYPTLKSVSFSLQLKF